MKIYDVIKVFFFEWFNCLFKIIFKYVHFIDVWIILYEGAESFFHEIVHFNILELLF